MFDDKANTKDIRHNFALVKCIPVDDPADRDILETYLINTLKPPLNREKVYTYTSNFHSDKYRTYEQLRKELLEQRKFDNIYLSLNL